MHCRILIHAACVRTYVLYESYRIHLHSVPIDDECSPALCSFICCFRAPQTQSRSVPIMDPPASERDEESNESATHAASTTTAAASRRQGGEGAAAAKRRQDEEGAAVASSRADMSASSTSSSRREEASESTSSLPLVATDMSVKSDESNTIDDSPGNIKPDQLPDYKDQVRSATALEGAGGEVNSVHAVAMIV